MPSFDAAGSFEGESVTLAASAARTASGSGGPVVMGARGTLRLSLAVTAASGSTPSMTVTVETSPDGTTWYSAGTFAAKTTTGSERKSFSGLDRYARAAWAITGTTPSFTFSVTGEAV